MPFSNWDEQLYQWLSQVKQPQSVRVLFNQPYSECVTVRCNDVYTAHELKSTQEKIFGKNPPKRLIIYVSGRMYSDSASGQNRLTDPSSTNMLLITSSWAKQYAEVFKNALPGVAYIHSANADSGYVHLAAKSEITEKRFNKPLQELLGQPLKAVSPEIALPRERAIQEAIATKQTQQYGYEAVWNGAIWRFKCKATLLEGHDEVLVIVQDAEAWQEGYWKNLAT